MTMDLVIREYPPSSQEVVRFVSELKGTELPGFVGQCKAAQDEWREHDAVVASSNSPGRTMRDLHL